MSDRSTPRDRATGPCEEGAGGGGGGGARGRGRSPGNTLGQDQESLPEKRAGRLEQRDR